MRLVELGFTLYENITAPLGHRRDGDARQGIAPYESRRVFGESVVASTTF
jgi:hypothetical protein